MIVAAKIGAPGNPELAIGAVGSDGEVWLDRDAIRRLGAPADFVERRREDVV